MGSIEWRWVVTAPPVVPRQHEGQTSPYNLSRLRVEAMGGGDASGGIAATRGNMPVIRPLINLCRSSIDSTRHGETRCFAI
nr:hypothetical protein [Candidatus Sigynarchaeota archaeon]